ncbi:NADH dehydrogenase [ubiquinone] 1 subunit C2-like [Pecten maximus]|uniref:NADH dehydrogenase [ubiquinone] 1 subunit C2-like n=1 Tax=Pecten maximus TaxID=6579 RepID=UPI0014582345|nr:NADH dehydrogenase [ubiquinone] 1 subunit C2-like [Pecten maximus]
MLMDLLFFASGFGGSALWNFRSGVPLHRGHPRNFACGVAFGVFGYYFRTKLDEMDRVRLFQLEEYVRTHPEDFPTIERKKWGEVFKEWKAPFRPDCD